MSDAVPPPAARHPLADVWVLCDRLDTAANTATRAGTLRPLVEPVPFEGADRG